MVVEARFQALRISTLSPVLPEKTPQKWLEKDPFSERKYALWSVAAEVIFILVFPVGGTIILPQKTGCPIRKLRYPSKGVRDKMPHHHLWRLNGLQLLLAGKRGGHHRPEGATAALKMLQRRRDVFLCLLGFLRQFYIADLVVLRERHLH